MRMGRGTGFTLALLAVAIVFLAQTIGLSATGRRVALPVVLLVAALLVVQLVRDARTPVARPERLADDGAPMAAPDQGPWSSLAWVLALPAMIAIAGVREGVLLHTFAFLRHRGREPLAVAVVGALVVAGLVWWVVGTLLGAELPGGLMGQLLTGP